MENYVIKGLTKYANIAVRGLKTAKQQKDAMLKQRRVAAILKQMKMGKPGVPPKIGSGAGG